MYTAPKRVNKLDKLLDESPFKDLKSGEDGDDKGDALENTFTSAELNRTIEILETRMKVCTEAGIIHTRVQETLQDYEKRDGDLRFGLSKRRRIADRTRILMESLLHSQATGSTRVRKTLGKLNVWVDSHDKEKQREDNSGIDSSDDEDDEPTIELDQIRISEREAADMLRKLGGAKKTLTAGFGEAISSQRKLWESRIQSEKEKTEATKVELREAFGEIRQRNLEIRQKEKDVAFEKSQVRDRERTIGSKNKEITSLKFEVKRANSDLEKLRESIRKQSPDGLSMEDLREMIEDLKGKNAEKESLVAATIVERDGFKTSLEILKEQLEKAIEKVLKYEELDNNDELNYDTDGNTLSEEQQRMKRKFERKMLNLREEAKEDMDKLVLREEKLKVDCENRIAAINDTAHQKVTQVKQAQITMEKRYLDKLKGVETENVKVTEKLKNDFKALEQHAKEERRALISNHVHELRSEKAKFESEMEKKEKEFEAELKFNRQQLLVMEAHVEKMHQRAEQYIINTRLRMKEDFDAAHEELVEKHSLEIKRWKQRVEDAGNNHGASYARMIEKCQGDLKRQRSEYLRKLEEVESKYDLQMAAQQESHQHTIQQLTEKHKNAQARWSGESSALLLERIDRLTAAKDGSEKKLKAAFQKSLHYKKLHHESETKVAYLQTLVDDRVQQVKGLVHKNIQLKNREIEQRAYSERPQEDEPDDRHGSSLGNDYVHKADVEKLVTNLVAKIDAMEHGGARVNPEVESTTSASIDTSQFWETFLEQHKKCVILAESIGTMSQAGADIGAVTNKFYTAVEKLKEVIKIAFSSFSENTRVENLSASQGVLSTETSDSDGHNYLRICSLGFEAEQSCTKFQKSPKRRFHVKQRNCNTVADFQPTPPDTRHENAGKGNTTGTLSGGAVNLTNQNHIVHLQIGDAHLHGSKSLYIPSKLKAAKSENKSDLSQSLILEEVTQRPKFLLEGGSILPFLAHST